LEIVERDREARGFEVLSKRWIVERTFSWLIRNRRLSKDYERMVQSSETFIKVAMIRLIQRLAVKLVHSTLWADGGYSKDSLVKIMNITERGMPKSKAAWVNIIASCYRAAL
jgi:hypothetical protein